MQNAGIMSSAAEQPRQSGTPSLGRLRVCPSKEVDLPAFTTETARAISDHLTKTLQAVSTASAGLQRRTNLLWWKEALFSPSARISYRELSPTDAAVLMAFDMHQQIPTFSPASVAAFLRETVVSLPTLDPEERSRSATWSRRHGIPTSFPSSEQKRQSSSAPGRALLRSRGHRLSGCHTATRRPRVPRPHRRQARHSTHLTRLVGLGIPGASGRSGVAEASTPKRRAPRKRTPRK